MWVSQGSSGGAWGSADLRRARSNGPWAPGPALWGGAGPGPKGPIGPKNNRRIGELAPRRATVHLFFSFFLRESMG